MSWIGQSYPMGVNSPNQSQASDLEILNKLYPGVILNPIASEAGGTYSVLREINGSQWTLQNAEIGANGFFQVNPAQSSWAFVLLLGGGFAMYMAAAGTAPGPTFWTRMYYVNAQGQSQSSGQYNVFNYGAKGDGVTNDAPAFQAALNAAAAAGGGVVFAPSATYAIATTLLMGNNTWLRGASRNSTILTCTANFAGAPVNGSSPNASLCMIANSMVAATTPGIVQRNMEVTDLQLNGRADIIIQVMTNPGSGIYFSQTENVSLERIEAYNMPNTVVQINSNTGSANWPTTFNSAFYMSHCRFNSTYNPYGPPPIYTTQNTAPINVLCRGINQVTIVNNVINDMVQDTGSIKSKDAFDVNGTLYAVIQGNSVYDVGDGVGFDTGSYANISDNILTRCNGDGIAMYASDGPANNSQQMYVVIDGNVITQMGADVAGATNPGKVGILINNNSASSVVTKGIMVTSNIIQYATTATGPTAIDIEGNHVICNSNIIDMGNCPNVTKGIRVNSASGGGNYCTVNDNTIFNGFAGTSVGVVINFNNANNITNLTLSGNQVNGVATQFFIDSSGGSLLASTSANNSWNPIGILVSAGTALRPTGTVVTNGNPYNVQVYMYGTSLNVSNISINGAQVVGTGGVGATQSVMLPPYATITVSYTGSGFWTWYAN